MRNAGDGRPTVLELVTRLNIGGPGQHVLSLVSSLSGSYRVELGAGHAPAEEGELATGSHVHRLPLVRSVSPVADGRALVESRMLIKRLRPAVVHTHMAKAGAVGRLAASSVRPRAATVHTFHGHVLSEYFPRSAQSVFVAAERRFARMTDVLVAVSPQIRDELLDLGVGAPGQYEVVPVGVDLDPLLDVAEGNGSLRSALGIAADTPLVGVMARLAPVKDHELLLESMSALPGTHLAVLGDGELRAHLEERTATAGLRDRVHFTGWWHDIPGALGDIDVVVLTSRNEGTPLSLIEASAAGRPVVATRVGGVPSVVVDGKTGFLVSRDADAVAGALRHLVEDPALRRSFGSAGREHVSGRFGAQRVAKALGEIYEELLRRRN